MEIVDKAKKDLVDRINTAVKELGLDSAVADIAERLVYGEQPQIGLDTYLFAQTADNERSEFQAAMEMQQKGLATTFWVVNGIEAEGFPGYANWQQGLGKMVGYEHVKPLPIPDEVKKCFWREGYQDAKTGLWIPAHCNVNTLSESQSLVAFAKAEQRLFWRILSTQIHFVRACMTVLSEIIKNGGGISAYCHLGITLPWDEVVAHSQGTQVASREQLLTEDMAKIQRYSNILPAKEIIGYMGSLALPPQPPQPLNSGGPAR